MQAAAADDDKRLDFDAPLLSTRRLSAPSQESAAAAENVQTAAPVQSRRASLPFYKSDVKTGPIGKPGIVPFVWEQTPGKPKDGPGPLSVRTRAAAPKPPPPPGRIVKETNSSSSSPPPPNSSPTVLKEAAAAVDTSIDAVRKQRRNHVDPHDNIHSADNDEEDNDEFADAMETLSRTESFFMTCSLGGVPCGPELTDQSGSFATDPQVRDFMMGRFLPAAQAMASSSPLCAHPRQTLPRREPMEERSGERFSNRGFQRSTLPYQYTADYVPRDGADLELENGFDDEDNDDDEYENDHTGCLSSKTNGFLSRFCLRNSLCLLNPVPGMKMPGRLPPQRAVGASNKTPLHNSLNQIGDEYSWEAVYKHKIVHGDCSRQDRITSETNLLMHWSDSPSADGSSPQQRSGGISPYRNEASQSPFNEGKGFLGIPKGGRKSLNSDRSESCDRDCGNSGDATTHSGSLKDSESMSAAIEKIKCADPVLAQEAKHYNSGSEGSTDHNTIDKPFKGDLQSQRTEISFTMEARERVAVQLEDSEVVESALLLHSERLDHGKVDNRNESKSYDRYCDPLPSKTTNEEQNVCKPGQSLLPPPLPNSPSESWLRRTLPSVSSKNTSSQSFLGIQMLSRKQGHGISAVNSKEGDSSKASKPHRQIRFADMLTKPVPPKSEA